MDFLVVQVYRVKPVLLKIIFKMTDYMLVKWENEDKKSIVKKSQIVSKARRNSENDKLVGKSMDISWSRKVYRGLIIMIDTKCEVEKTVNASVVKTKKKIIKKNQQSLQQMMEITDTLPCSNECLPSASEDMEIDWKILYEKEKQRSEKYKNKCKSLKAKMAATDEKQELQLVDGLSIPEADLETIKAISSTPTLFARNLMRAVFTDEDLLGKSLFGRKCNANKINTCQEVDPIGRNAVIRETMRQYNVPGNETTKKGSNPLMVVINRTLGDYIREVNKKYKTTI